MIKYWNLQMKIQVMAKYQGIRARSPSKGPKWNPLSPMVDYIWNASFWKAILSLLCQKNNISVLFWWYLLKMKLNSFLKEKLTTILKNGCLYSSCFFNSCTFYFAFWITHAFSPFRDSLRGSLVLNYFGNIFHVLYLYECCSKVVILSSHARFGKDYI